MPHVIALDEPTNYLDNDSVAALTKALKDKGAVVTVSENEAFVDAISNEKLEIVDRNVVLTSCATRPASGHPRVALFIYR